MARKLKNAVERDAPVATASPDSPPPDTQAQARARAFAIEAARALDDDKCEDVALLDVRGLSQLCDFIVIGSGSSDRQMRSAADEVAGVGKEMGHAAVRRNVDERTTWYVCDFVDVVVHVFEPNTRAYYDIEMMWGDAPRVEWRRPTPRTTTRRSRIKPASATEE
ncbi:MAG: ribosome silencing factor [Phycisphaerales bacterium]